MNKSGKNTTQKTSDAFDAFGARYSDTVNEAVAFSGLDVDLFTRIKADYVRDIALGHFGNLTNIHLLDAG